MKNLVAFSRSAAFTNWKDSRCAIKWRTTGAKTPRENRMAIHMKNLQPPTGDASFEDAPREENFSHRGEEENLERGKDT